MEIKSKTFSDRFMDNWSMIRTVLALLSIISLLAYGIWRDYSKAQKILDDTDKDIITKIKFISTKSGSLVCKGKIYNIDQYDVVTVDNKYKIME